MNGRWVLTLARAVYLLSLSGDSQKAFLNSRHLAPSCDEIGLLFEDANLMVPQLVESGAITQEEAAILTDLNDRLNGMTSWDISSLNEPDWENVRSIARSFFGHR
jgi:hypothetical protein